MQLKGYLGSRRATLVLETLEVVSDELPTPGDLLIEVSVSVGSFNAQESVWVDQRVHDTFVRDLESLEATRQGGAELNGMSPGEFTLSVYATDTVGHPAIRGHIGGANRALSLEFRFDFDAEHLAALVAGVRGLARK